MQTQSAGYLRFSQPTLTRTPHNNMTTLDIKFGIRFGNSKRGTIINGKTVQEHLVAIGATDYCITPNGGWMIKNGATFDFAITIY